MLSLSIFEVKFCDKICRTKYKSFIVKMNAKKTAEAEEHLRLAAKALKTGLLKWNPDYDTAGDEYSRAATAFKVQFNIFIWTQLYY